jgi:hypothetical protein
MVQRLHRSLAFRRWSSRGRPVDETPSDNLHTYRDNKTASMAQYLSTLSGYFEKAQKGDFALVYPKSFNQLATVVEFVDEPSDYREVAVPNFVGETLPARRVKKLTKIAKTGLPSAILDVIQKPNVFVTAPRSSKAFLYERALGVFAFEDEFNLRVNVGSAVYSSRADMLLAALVNYATANVLRAENDVIRFREAAFMNLGHDTPVMRSNINSPGYEQYRSTTVGPILAAVIIALAIAIGPDAAAVFDAGNFEIINSAAIAGDECSARVRQDVMDYFDLNGIIADWPAACAAAREVAEMAETSTSITVREVP